MNYKSDTIYQAFVDKDNVFARLYFVVDYEGHRFTIKDAYDKYWHIFPVNAQCNMIRYESTSGIWRLNRNSWTLEVKDWCYIAVVSKADNKDPYVIDGLPISTDKEKMFADINKEIQESIREKCGVPPEYYADPNILEASIYGLNLETANRCRQGVITNIEEKGDDKMSKYLWHVILFNTDTEKIDFKGYIPACSGSDAQMLAAQTFGKFDPKVHAVNCKQIMSYGKED